MRHITLLTDFGVTEGEHTVLKGVIWNIHPGVPIADLSHHIEAQNVLAASLVLQRTAFFFPPETVHIVVVDPGVGTHRRPIAARFGEQFFVGPDNGVATTMLEYAEERDQAIEIVELDKPEYWLPRVTSIFHGRDPFAPSGAHLAKGVSLSELGTPITDMVRLHLPKPTITDTQVDAEIIDIDYYGNIVCNLRREHLKPAEQVSIEIAGVTLPHLVETFGDVPIGDLAALFSHNDYLMIAETNGNAATRLGVKIGTPVKINRK